VEAEPQATETRLDIVKPGEARICAFRFASSVEVIEG
jgi:hypothetical protein